MNATSYHLLTGGLQGIREYNVRCIFMGGGGHTKTLNPSVSSFL